MPTENNVPKARTTTGQTKFEGSISVRFPSALFYIKIKEGNDEKFT